MILLMYTIVHNAILYAYQILPAATTTQSKV